MSRASEMRWAVGLGSAALSLLASWAAYGIEGAYLSAAVLAFHELGHAVVMRRLGYEVVGIVFVPFLCGLTVGVKANATPRESVAAWLAGPAPGIALALVLLALGVDREPLGRVLIHMLIVVNLLNLLPLWPLDGGRVAMLLLRSASERAIKLVTFSSIAGLVALGLVLSAPWLFVVAALAFGTRRYNVAMGDAADANETAVLFLGYALCISGGFIGLGLVYRG
ncbi:MAG: hypothetical protein IPG45_15790 [Deltaproteobacteria bacterium]|nr:hypothetical protein [Deltaproteobacteria bacterium]